MPNIVEVTVKSLKGKCDFGHKVGDKIIFDGKSVKGDICLSALLNVLPRVFALYYGFEVPWGKDKDAIINACPDAKNPVVFEIRRIRK